MIQFKTYIKQNKLVILNLEESFDGFKVYKLSDIHSVTFKFFDDSSNSGYFHINLKKDIYHHIKPQQLCLAFDGEDSIDDEVDDFEKPQLLQCIFSYANVVSVENEDHFGDCIFGYMLKVVLIFSNINISVELPDMSHTFFTQYCKSEIQEQVLNRLKDDFLFKHIFSKN